MRRVAKTVVFGIVYGISPFGLSQNLGVPQAEAKKYIETFFERFAAVRALMDRKLQKGRRKGTPPRSSAAAGRFPNCRAAIRCSVGSASAWR